MHNLKGLDLLSRSFLCGLFSASLEIVKVRLYPKGEYVNENIKSEMQKHQQNQRLSAAELGYLWAQYLGDTLYVCVLGYFLSVVKDPVIKEL
ncbi:MULTISPECIES: DUF3231 family protein [Priestia]|uniref:DUF3231 family protein n=1 Tax=Priestia TaxID=2800373 RepID=UPI001F46C624|nr:MULTISPECIES: DUF3231 family protein [Priestia]MCM3644992.1 DUF3231 family protein [Priestia aryabhattai]